MTFKDRNALQPLQFTRRLQDARDFEKAAFADIKPYIENQDADFDNAKLAAHWLEGDHAGDVAYICVLFLIPYEGGGGGAYGYRIYIAMPERLFGAEVDVYLFGGVVTLVRNEEAYKASGSSSLSRFYDLVTFYQGHPEQLYAFEASETQYKRIYSTARARSADTGAPSPPGFRSAPDDTGLAARSCSEVRWRGFDQASAVEKGLIDWLVTDVFPGRHDPARTEGVAMSRQNLFVGDPSLQHLFVIPAADAAEGPSFYVIYLEGPDNPAVIGDNMIGEPLLYVHGSWIVEGAKVLSTRIAGGWSGYVYDGSQYLLTTPSATSPSRRRTRAI